MELQALTQLFMLSSILNGGILILWTVLFMLAPDLLYRIQSFWFPIPKERGIHRDSVPFSRFV
ncbi:MAG: DUF6868 family protein [Pseudomonadota bacterium]